MLNIGHSNKDVLAKLMATENITVLHKKVPTAYFDVKNRTLVCPMLKDDMSSEMYDLFMGHEVGHALNTPMEGWHDSVCEFGPVFKGYLNVVEDVRIEKEIKAKYPGLRRSFYQGYKELNEDNFFGLDEQDINKLNLIDKINIHFKIGAFSQVSFTNEETVYIKRCENLKTFEEVLALAKELFEKQQTESKDKMESMTQEQLKELMEELGIDSEENQEGNIKIEVPSEEGEGEGTPGENSEEDESEEGSSDGKGNNEEKEDNKKDGKSDSSDGEGENNKQSKSKRGGKSPEEKLEDELNKSKTDEEFRENEGGLHANKYEHTEPNYYELNGKIKYNNFIVPSKEIDEVFSKSNLNRTNIHKYTKNFIDNNKKIINYMVKEFEMKKAAADYKRSQSSKTGEIDMSKLHQYLLKDDIFNRIQVVPEGKNHGVVMILDWSGSMSGSVLPTLEQASLLSMFARRLQIPFRLFAFSDNYTTEKEAEESSDYYHKKSGYHYDDKEYKKIQAEWNERKYIKTFGKNPFDKDDIRAWSLDNLKLLEIFNEKMSNSEFTRSMENWFELGHHNDNYYGYYDTPKSLNHDENFRTPSQLNLGGTPLDHSIVLMRDYLQDFQRDYGLDITTFITLTDGQSHGVFNGRNVHLVDRRYNKVHKMKGYRGSTRGLLRWLKETANVRTIGFYLSNAKGQSFYYDSESFSGVNIESWTDEGVAKKKEFTKLATTFEDKKGNYDLSIIINQKKLELNYDEDELQVEVGANKGALKRALVKAGNNKMQQRVILNKFVQQMAV
jgi:hypothetical protein